MFVSSSQIKYVHYIIMVTFHWVVLICAVSNLAVGHYAPTSNVTTCDCGVPHVDQDKVVGGQQTTIKEHPWMVSLHRTALLLFMGSKASHLCGGTLISQNWVLTAAHCVVKYSRFPQMITINIGGGDLSTGPKVKTVQKMASHIVVHSSYSASKLTNDIAVIRLSSPVSYGETVVPICLPSLDLRNLDGRTVTVAGYGATSEGGPGSAILLKADIPVVSESDCRIKYNSTGVTITDEMFCAGQAGRDSCQGDSGGPVQVDCSDHRAIVGIVSFGIGCARADYPGVYTRVTSFLSWIQEATGSEELCKRDSCDVTTAHQLLMWKESNRLMF